MFPWGPPGAHSRLNPGRPCPLVELLAGGAGPAHGGDPARFLPSLSARSPALGALCWSEGRRCRCRKKSAVSRDRAALTPSAPLTSQHSLSRVSGRSGPLCRASQLDPDNSDGAPGLVSMGPTWPPGAAGWGRKEGPEQQVTTFPSAWFNFALAQGAACGSAGMRGTGQDGLGREYSGVSIDLGRTRKGVRKRIARSSLGGAAATWCDNVLGHPQALPCS